MQGHIIKRDCNKKVSIPANTIPLSTVLSMGGGTWALKEEEKRMSEVFYHGAIRRITGISRQRIYYDEKTTNSAVRKKFLNLPTMMNLLNRRVLKYIGRAVREEKEIALHKSFLTAYCHSSRHVGGQQHSHTGDLFIECVRTILLDTPHVHHWKPGSRKHKMKVN
jgi:hypothetical protein